PVLSPTDILTQMTQQAPRSTLYPYTTLFRSQVQIGKQQVFSPAAAAPRLQHFRQKGPGEKQKDRESDGQGAAAEGGGQHQGEGGDRKSTRLNSSHVKISYAVFCLKKKTKETR